MRKYSSEFALLFVTFIWGFSYILTEVALGQFETFQIIAVRFLLSTLILGAVFYKKIFTIEKTDLMYGAALGLLLIAGYAFQITGQIYTTPAKSAFIIATSVVIVPFIGTLVYRRRIDTYNIYGAFTALAGVALITFAFDSHINLGDVLTFVSAIVFAFHLFYTSEFMSRGADTGSVVTVQIGVCCLIALIATLITGQTDFTNARTDGIMSLLFMAVFATAFCFFVQAWAQKSINETKAAIILSMECVFCAMVSVALGFDILTLRMFFGAVLILIGVLITEIRD